MSKRKHGGKELGLVSMAMEASAKDGFHKSREDGHREGERTWVCLVAADTP